MINNNSDALPYRIAVRGDCGRLLASLLDDVQVESCEGDTYVVALLRGDPEFYGLMERLGDLALHVVSLQELDQGNGLASAT